MTTDKSTKRKPCAYGESCYRKNPAHRQQVSHPGDPDWETEDNNNDKNKSKPECPYGAECYRKNPEHFIEYHHPRKRVIEIKTKKRGRKRTGKIFNNIHMNTCKIKSKRFLLQTVKM